MKRNSLQLHLTRNEITLNKILNFKNNPSKKSIIIDYNRLKMDYFALKTSFIFFQKIINYNRLYSDFID